jgi:hypothetical protein
VLLHCFGNCDRLDVVDALRRRGLLDERDESRLPRRHEPSPARPVLQEPDPVAVAIWTAASPAEGSPVEAYLRSRNITLAVPPSLRCGSAGPHRAIPAMIAAVQAPNGKIVAVQTTLLSPAGAMALVAVRRFATGTLGPGAVRLAKAEHVLGLAEGIETALSAQQLTGVPTWACLGASRMHRVAIPDHVRELHLFGDNDDPGRDAVERTACENRHRTVVPRFPPDHCKDWNDILTAT